MSSLSNPAYEGILNRDEHINPYTDSPTQSFDKKRDFYEHLFSLDSDDTEFLRQETAAQKLFTQEFHKVPDEAVIGDDDDNGSISSLISYQSDNFIQNMDFLNLHHLKQENTCDISNSNSDMSISTEPYTGDTEEEHLSVSLSSKGDSLCSATTYNSLKFLDEEEIFSCFHGETLNQEAHKKWEKRLYEKSDKDANVDVIATYNIQNRYDHTIAAELMMKQNITFLALQEPHASHHRKKQGWSNFRCKELASARITAFETDLQVILYDNWKWGGKEISKFQSHQNGRIAAIAFGFKNNQKVGIISIYSITDSSHSSEEERREAENIRNTTTFLVRKISKQWKDEHPGIGIVIMGDLQETLTETDADNIGKCRKPMLPNGILKNSANTHLSIVRAHTNDQPYVTRFGSVGGRGIDHILVPNDASSRDWFIGGSIDKIESAKFFPSDHALLTCSFVRHSSNNKMNGDESEVSDFKKIFQIKVKRTGINNDEIILDESQFKGSKTYLSQQTLFKEIQRLTADTSNESDTYLDEIEKSIKILYGSLWRNGVRQQVEGNKNKLVSITESQALRLSYITKTFNANVKAVMSALKLTKIKDLINHGGVVRKSLHKGKGFQQFKNLPIPTKLRYFNTSITRLASKVIKMKHDIKRWDINNQMCAGDHAAKFDFNTLHQILDSNLLVSEASSIRQAYLAEVEERQEHVQAMSHFEKRYKTAEHADGSTTLEKTLIHTESQDNKLDLSDKNIKLINAWLAEEGCHQGFNIISERDKFKFLNKDDMAAWKHGLLHWDEHTVDVCNSSTRVTMIQDLERAESVLGKLRQNVISAQCDYKIQTLNYFINTNKISSFTNKVLPKNRDAPIPHSHIWDPKIRRQRRCKNEAEEMIATGLHHHKWMSPSAAKESCAFAEVVREGNLGPRGIKLKSTRKVTIADIPTLIKNGHKLPMEIKKKFVLAHGEHTASLFCEPEKDREEFFYPFFLIGKEGEINKEDMLKESFMKAITGIPGKARHEGFQMAVLGRFGKRWRNVMYDLVKLMLIMRYVPPDLKKISRFPIPKPGRVGEYRPISLCHDMYCFLNGIVTVVSSQGIEKAKILHDGLTSYRPGMGCTTLVGVEQAFREDCVQSGIPSAQIDEDEEKFFDRIPLEIILAAMRVCGFPNQGFLEFKASCMDNKNVEIITNRGSARATFSCGLEQGNPNSPTIANLVILMKHKIWNMLCEELLEKLGKQAEDFHKYSFHIVDRKDGTLEIKMMGYCDDNSRFLSTVSEEDLILLTQRYIRLTGDLSMVTKIGRKGSKSEIHFFNLSASIAAKLEEVETIAWSFSEDMPTREFVPFKLCLQEVEEKNMRRWIESNDELSEDDKEKWRLRLYPEEHRHLGLTSTLKGAADGTRTKVIKKIKKRLIDINSQKLSEEAQKICNNMLCTSIPTFAPLQSNHSVKELYECDKLVAQLLRKRRGLTKSDAMHRFWIHERLGGFGFKSFLEEDIISVTRELEVVLNSQELDSRALRARLEAYNKEPGNPSMNHVKEAILKLGKYGIYIRDGDNEILNHALGILSIEKRYAPVGSAAFKVGNTATIGLGKDKLLDLAMGGKIESLLLGIIAGKSEATLKKEYGGGRFPISFNKLSKIVERARHKRFSEVTAAYKFFEWSFSEKAPNIPMNIDEWKFVDLGHEFKKCFPDSFLDKESGEIETWCQARMKINLEVVENSLQLPNQAVEYNEMKMKILDSESPLIIATDGSHKVVGKRNETTAAFVACKLRIEEHESVCDGAWEDRTMEPLLARIAILPQKFGLEPTDISHGEALALWLQECSFDGSVARGVITDSAAVRQCLINVRNNAADELGRSFIRKVSSGVSKFIVGAFRNTYRNNTIDKEYEENTSHGQDSSVRTKNKIWKQSLHLRLQIFIRQAREWSSKHHKDSDDKIAIWPLKYWDEHDQRPIFKINSHQLNIAGESISEKPRYPHLTPKLAPLNANHWADLCAGLPKTCHFQDNKYSGQIHLPRLAQRFFITWGGETLDKDIACRLRKIFLTEKLKRLRSKPTQGLLWRLMPSISTSWNNILEHKGWLRSLAGFSNSHTRALYKSEIYRNGNWIEHHPDTPLEATTITSRIKEALQCTWCEQKEVHGGECKSSLLEKGNRYHHLFHCKHTKLRRFRNRIDGLIERNLMDMIKIMMTAGGIKEAERGITRLMSCIRELDMENVGRLEMMNMQQHKSRTVEEWCSTLKTGTIIEAILQKKVTIKELLQISPEAMTPSLEDRYVGTCNAMQFGLIPIRIQGMIEKISQFREIHGLESATRRVLSKEFLKYWDLLTQLLIARAGGMHRLMSGVCKQREIDWKNTYKDTLMLQGFQDIKQELIKNKSKKRKSTPLAGLDGEKKRKIVATASQKACSGISCRKGATAGISIDNKCPTFIPQGTRQCQRCSKWQMAMRKGAHHLHRIASEQSPATREKVLDNIKQQSTSSPDFISLMNLLNDKTDSEVGNKVQFKSKGKRISDQDKLVCRVIVAEIQEKQRFKQIEMPQSNARQEEVKQCARGLDRRLSANKKLMDEDINHERKILKEINRTNREEKGRTIIDLVSSQEGDTKSNEICEDENMLQAKTNNKKALMMTRWQLFSGNDLDKDIEISRAIAGTDTFLADQDATVLIQSYKLTDPWERFGRMFRSGDVRARKPPGVYLIPMFWGNTGNGHWSTIVVWRCGRRNRGYHLDSLGTSNTKGEVFDKIKSAFTGRRDRFTWVTTKCWPQVESECGFRTVEAIRTICLERASGTEVEMCVRMASLEGNVGAQQYCSLDLRRKVASRVTGSELRRNSILGKKEKSGNLHGVRKVSMRRVSSVGKVSVNVTS